MCLVLSRLVWCLLLMAGTAGGDESTSAYDRRQILPLLDEGGGATPTNCSLNACDVVRLISHLFRLLHSSAAGRATSGRAAFSEGESPQDEDSTEQDMASDAATVMVRRHTADGGDLLKRIRQLESRLRAVEQPLWRLAAVGPAEWVLCEAGVCRCNSLAKSFTCWDTRLKSLPLTQVIPMNMVTIDLSGNELSTLHKDTFRGLTLLRELDLSANGLNFLPAELFRDLDSLTQLHLQSNRLEDLDEQIFWKLRHLVLLDLSRNSLVDLPAALFNHVERVRVINLCGNNLRVLHTGLLQDQAALEELDMSRNAIAELRTGSMRNLGLLKILDLSVNMIENIAEDFFVELKSLRTLILHNNRITTVSRKIFEHLDELGSLDLTRNRIATIEPYAFSRLNNLRELLLGQNQLSYIPDGLFANTLSLNRLTLFSNNFTALEEGDFEGLVNLKHLLLNNNLLKYLDPLTFAPLRSLEKLRIDSNKLMFLPHGCLDSLEQLVAIKLDKNPWHCDCRALYLARWIREYVARLWDTRPLCRGPGDLGGHEVGLLRYDDLCDGQWASMLSLSPRLPVRKHRISKPMNYSDYFDLYLKHIYTSTTTTTLPLLGVEGNATTAATDPSAAADVDIGNPTAEVRLRGRN